MRDGGEVDVELAVAVDVRAVDVKPFEPTYVDGSPACAVLPLPVDSSHELPVASALKPRFVATSVKLPVPSFSQSVRQPRPMLTP